MNDDPVLSFAPIPHPAPQVRRFGFDLSSPYVEQCWGHVVGPSATLLLRRLPVLWAEAAPATISRLELARTLGLGSGTQTHSRLMHTIERLVGFGLARWDARGTALAVYQEVPPLGGRHLSRAPAWTRDTHERLLGRHIDARVVSEAGGQAAGAPGDRRGGPPPQRRPEVSTVSHRLDDLQRRDARPRLQPTRVLDP